MRASGSLPAAAVTAVVGVVAPFAIGVGLARGSVVTWAQGGWSWFGDPRAVHAGGPSGTTYVGWIDWSGGVTVGAYDPALASLRDVIVGRVYHDDHSDPSIFVEPDGRLTVFWSAHNGAQMYYRTTIRPGDIAAWTPVAQVHQRIPGSDGFTYPNPVLLPAERDRLYLFWRGADWSAEYATRSTDGRWSSARGLVRSAGQRPYVKVAGDGSARIALAFTDGHPRNLLSSIYYATYRHGSLWTAGGTWIARIADGPVAPQRAELVYDARRTHVPAWVWDVAFDRRRRPVIVYATFPRRSQGVYWYALFTGRRWVSHRLVAAGGSISPRTSEYEYSGGIGLDHADPAVVYLSRQVRGGWEIERWTTSSGGAGWRHRVVVPADGTDNLRPVVPRGSSSGSMSLLWLRGSYGSYTTYRTSIAFLK